jgi:hypothetical protein
MRILRIFYLVYPHLCSVTSNTQYEKILSADCTDLADFSL